jgi:ABC-type nitrate/sulfonate/bicarbonate transport system permease component
MGNLISVAAARSRYDLMWACVVVVTLIAAVGYGVVAVIERTVLSRVAPEQMSW